MRALFDTNIFISYLLPTTEEGPIVEIVEAAITGAFTLLLPEEVVAEFSRTVARKPYLAQRIDLADAETLINELKEGAEVITAIGVPIPVVTRDRKDDYLLAYALLGQADYLVTGDKDLLVLGQVDQVQIVRPAEFLETLLRQSEEC